MKEAEVIEIFKALSVTSRVRIIRLIRERQLCVNALAIRLRISPSAVSQHLKVLKKCHLVYAERYGSIMHYRVNNQVMHDFTVAVEDMLTGNQKSWKPSLKSKT